MRVPLRQSPVTSALPSHAECYNVQLRQIATVSTFTAVEALTKYQKLRVDGISSKSFSRSDKLISRSGPALAAL
jgi:hypothetical protein